jgi:preprotein translocase subunit SecA
MFDADDPAAAIALPRQRIYAEREVDGDGVLDRAVHAVAGRLVAATSDLRRTRLTRIVRLVDGAAHGLATASDNDLRRGVGRVRDRLRRHPSFDDASVARSFALVREVSSRVLAMRHHDVQLIGGFALLKGMVAEMATGEGKTLVATLAAGTAALAGVPVHVVTVNDYLAERDAAWMAPIYAFLGVSVGVVVGGRPPDQRRAAYGRDVTYCTNKELAFDYLRDRVILGARAGNLQLKMERLCGRSERADRLLLRGLHFAIVDEADSVLVDEARTPLILSGHAESQIDAATAKAALDLAAALMSGADYRLLMDERRVVLTQSGRDRLDELTDAMAGPWRRPVVREELVAQALTAIHLIRRDEHYLVADDAVHIIDEYSGRVLPDRHWTEGLHQIIECKEGCRPSPRRITLARMTYQRFFRRYARLAGMTGTAREVARELWWVYRLPVATIPPNRPVRRLTLPDRVLPSVDEKWRAIVGRIAELNGRGCPVLLGTRSVAASEQASRCLTDAGLAHVVLNAAQDRHEADIIAVAGRAGRITVATNMAGRGTDIVLGDGVADLGGLHVIMSERHDARRIDRQLAGRCARQGQPGCFQAILSLDDPLMAADQTGLVRWLARTLAPVLGPWVARAAIRHVQRRTEAMHFRMRCDLLRSDTRLSEALAFSGAPE